MDLKTQDYEDAASSTIPPIVHTDAVRPAVVFHLLSEFAKAGDNLNKYLKKPFVYGPTRITEEHIAQFVGLADIDPPRDLTDEERAFAHGVVGIATEAAECVEALMKVWFFGEPWDRVNAMEEGGDLLWYIVRMLKAAGYTLPEAMEKNWSKLENRHVRSPGQSFNPDADRNRDLDAERALLEAPAGVRAIVEGAAADAPQAAVEHRTTDSRGVTFGSRGIALMVTRGDQGQEEIWLDSYAGGGAPGGEWATLTTALYLGPDANEEAIRRTYIACDLLAPDGVKIKVGDLEVSATGVHADKLLEREKPEPYAGPGSFAEAHGGRHKNMDLPSKPIHGTD